MPSSGELSQLIKDGSITFDEVIVHDKLKDDFKRQDSTIHQYLLSHATELTNTALGLRNKGNELAQGISFQLIISQIQLFSRKLAQNQDFLNTMHNALFDNDTFEGKGGPAFARIFQFMIQSSLTPFLVSLPEKERFFSQLLKMRNVPAIANLLVFLTDNNDTRVVNFLEANNAVKVLIEKLSGDEDNDETIVRYIHNIVSSVDHDSPVLDPLSDNSFISRLFSIGTTAKNEKLAACALGIMDQLVSSFADDSTDGIDKGLMQNTLRFITGHVKELCEFIKKEGIFLKSKFNAIGLLSAGVIVLTSIPPEVWDVLEYLWNNVFVFPSHTFLHRSFLTLFESMLSDSPDIDAFVDRLNMHHSIVDAYSKRKEKIASYWSCLYTVADFISERGTCDDEWKSFINGVFTDITSIVSKSYGGPTPREDFFDTSDSDDFHFKKDLVFDNDSEEDDEDMFGWNAKSSNLSDFNANQSSRNQIFDDSSDDDDFGISSTNKLLFQGSHFGNPFCSGKLGPM